MSAQEIIEQIKALPPREKEEVLDFIRGMDVSAPGQPQFIDQKDVEAAAERIFDEHDELFRKLAQ